MIPVEQQNLSMGCVRACLASIFELAYEALPAELEVPELQFPTMSRWFQERGWAVQNYTWSSRADAPQRCPRYFPCHWMGSVVSPRFVEEDGTASLHAVVMRGSELVWDPHPRRDMGHKGFVAGEVFYPRDIARFVLR